MDFVEDCISGGSRKRKLNSMIRLSQLIDFRMNGNFEYTDYLPRELPVLNVFNTDSIKSWRLMRKLALEKNHS